MEVRSDQQLYFTTSRRVNGMGCGRRGTRGARCTTGCAYSASGSSELCFLDVLCDGDGKCKIIQLGVVLELSKFRISDNLEFAKKTLSAGV